MDSSKLRLQKFQISPEKRNPFSPREFFAVPAFSPGVLRAVGRRIAVQQKILNARRKFLERSIEIESVRVGRQFQRALQIGRR